MKRNAYTDGCGPARHGHRPNVPQQGLRGGCQGYLEATAPSVQYRTITTDGLSVQLHIIRAHVASERRGASLPHHIDLPHALPLPVRTAPAQNASRLLPEIEVVSPCRSPRDSTQELPEALFRQNS